MAKNNKKADDKEMIEAISRSEAFVNKYKYQLIGGFVAIIIIAVAFIAYSSYKTKKEAEASAAISKAWIQAFSSSDYDKALKGDSTYIGFVKAMDEYSGTDAADLAKVLAGESYAQQGKYKEAIKLLDGFDKGDKVITPAIRGLLGECYANEKDYDKAIKAFKEAAKMADNNSISPRYLIEAGTLLEAQGKKDEALKCYEEIKAKYQNSMYASEIDKYIERVK